MTAFAETPRTFDELAHDVGDVCEHAGAIAERSWNGGTSSEIAIAAHVAATDLAWQVQRLARQVGELAQRLAGDTETGDAWPWCETCGETHHKDCADHDACTCHEHEETAPTFTSSGKPIPYPAGIVD